MSFVVFFCLTNVNQLPSSRKSSLFLSLLSIIIISPALLTAPPQCTYPPSRLLYCCALSQRRLRPTAQHRLRNPTLTTTNQLPDLLLSANNPAQNPPVRPWLVFLLLGESCFLARYDKRPGLFRYTFQHKPSAPRCPDTTRWLKSGSCRSSTRSRRRNG